MKTFSTTQLVSWGTRSCGCLQRERQRTPRKGKHKRIWTTEYRLWQSIKTRCYNANVREYVNYGGRGIQMSEPWRKSFVQFLEDVGERPSPEHTLDRIDNDGHYKASNVRWATRKQQMANRRPRSEWNKKRKTSAKTPVKNNEPGTWTWRGKTRGSE